MVRFTDMADGLRRVGKAQRRHGFKEAWDVVNGGKKMANEGMVTSFFSTEFWDKWSAKDLFYELKEFGDLEEVFIPPRRDRRRKRYGFARFQNVKDGKMLAIKLDNIVLEGRKLYSNLPRFQRPVKTINKIVRVRDSSSANLANNSGSEYKGRTDSRWVDKRSFADVIMNQKASTLMIGAGSVSKSFSLAVEAEDLNRYGRAFIRVLRNPTLATKLKNIFYRRRHIHNQSHTVGT